MKIKTIMKIKKIMKITNAIIAMFILAFSEILFAALLKSTGFLRLVWHYLTDMIFIFADETHGVQVFLTIMYGVSAAVLAVGILYAMLFTIPRFILVSFDVIKAPHNIGK